ncbi:CPCC family cysteine-rich protein [Streptomyces xanthophaeus]|uniref:CPCC family cysteine-rich protein n=1 Tax=Streptomyces xanthophaeus TaxID=67385 RepID=UPI003659024B
MPIPPRSPSSASASASSFAPLHQPTAHQEVTQDRGKRFPRPAACNAGDRSRRSCETPGVMTPRELRAACPEGAGPYPCPCCKLPTLEARGGFEICHECSWEDDGQDDLNADEVWGGPNGSESLTEARARYAQYVETARATDPRSLANGGRGRWLEACLSHRASRSRSTDSHPPSTTRDGTVDGMRDPRRTRAESP